jgi:putative glycosyltransferase (TIGR04348 family)
MPHSRPTIVIATPALRGANNGNWRTAHRWQQMLSGRFYTILQNADSIADDVSANTGLLIALHARRAADCIAAFRKAYPRKPIVLVMTGTDLYRDLEVSETARSSIATADALVVLQDDAVRFLPENARAKAWVIYQSAKTLIPAKKPAGKLNCIVVGHLRAEKSPETVFQMAALIPKDVPIHILHLGGGLDPDLARTAKLLSASSAHYRWQGSLPHGLTRAAIKRAHLLIHPSVMEGGANVITEAITAGTPVLASDISGNVGMLGRDYPGYFPAGDAVALARLVKRCLDEPVFLGKLQSACQKRAKLFAPAREKAALIDLVNHLLK